MRYRISCMVLLVILVMFGVVFDAEALRIYDYSSITNDRFSSGYSSDPVNNTNFFAASYNWSGVGWNATNHNMSIAMISPLHFVSANHYKPGIGGSVAFFNQDEQLESNTVESYSTMTSYGGTADLILGELSTSVSDAVTHYPVLWFDEEDDYIDLELYVYGWTALSGHNTLDGFNTINNYTRCFRYDYDYVTGEAGGVGGDSGSPTFIPWGSQLTVLGTKFAVSDSSYPEGYRTYDSSIPYYVDQLNNAMSGSGYQVTLVPEPSAFLLLAGGVMSLLVCMKFRANKD